MTNNDPGSGTPPRYLPALLELTLLVHDVDRSARFYRAIGFTLFDVDEPGLPHHVDGGIGSDAGFQLFPAGGGAVTRVQLGFRVPDRAAVAAELDGLDISYELPMIRRLTTRDPDGNRIHLTEMAKNA